MRRVNLQIAHRCLATLVSGAGINHGTLTLRTGGPGSDQHVSGIYFQSATATALRFARYRAGPSDIMKDLV
jgi:hypothetical protein